MATFRRFATFVACLTIAFALLGLLFGAINAYLDGQTELEPYLFIAWPGAAFGFMTSALGFWLMFLMRKIQIWRFRVVAIGVALVIDGFIVESFMRGQGWVFTWRVVLFPLAPILISAYIFEQLALRYIRVPKMTHH